MNIKSTSFFPTSIPVISDGKIDTENLHKLKLDEKWLYQQLESAGVKAVAEIFYAEVQQNGTLYIDRKNDNIK